MVGRFPTTDEIGEVVRDFWEFCHETYDKPQSRREMGRTLGTCVHDDLSSGQENAIRVLEDAEL